MPRRVCGRLPVSAPMIPHCRCSCATSPNPPHHGKHKWPRLSANHSPSDDTAPTSSQFTNGPANWGKYRRSRYYVLFDKTRQRRMRRLGAAGRYVFVQFATTGVSTAGVGSRLLWPSSGRVGWRTDSAHAVHARGVSTTWSPTPVR